jgi:hypothetical protein
LLLLLLAFASPALMARPPALVLLLLIPAISPFLNLGRDRRLVSRRS